MNSATFIYKSFSYGMAMPGKDQQADYRYGYQGEYSEKEELGGTHSFELRLWDARIGRWLSPDPKGEFHSPYLGMGNAPMVLVDPDGGSTEGPDCKPGAWNWIGRNIFFGAWGKYENTPSIGEVEVIGVESLQYKPQSTVWGDSSIHLNEGPWFLNLETSVTDNTSNPDSFDFTAIRFNKGYNDGNFRQKNNLDLVKVNGGASFGNDRVGAFIGGTFAQPSASMGYGGLDFTGTANFYTGYLGGYYDGRSGANAGAYAAEAEFEGTLSYLTDDKRWGLSSTFGISVGSYGGKFGFNHKYNHNNNAVTFKISGKAAEVFGLIGDLEVTFPVPNFE